MVRGHVSNTNHRSNAEVFFLYFKQHNNNKKKYNLFYVLTFKIHELNLKFAELEMPDESKLSNLSKYLIEFYNQNVIDESNLKRRYDIFNEFKEKFLEKYPSIKLLIQYKHVYTVFISNIFLSTSSTILYI